MPTGRNAASRPIRTPSRTLAIFAPLALSVVALGIGDGLTATACMIYFFARLAHFVVYTAGIPGLRTIAFTAGFIVQVLLALRVMGLM